MKTSPCFSCWAWAYYCTEREGGWRQGKGVWEKRVEKETLKPDRGKEQNWCKLSSCLRATAISLVKWTSSSEHYSHIASHYSYIASKTNKSCRYGLMLAVIPQYHSIMCIIKNPNKAGIKTSSVDPWRPRETQFHLLKQTTYLEHAIP